jgi:hypothetical protein
MCACLFWVFLAESPSDPVCVPVCPSVMAAPRFVLSALDAGLLDDEVIRLIEQGLQWELDHPRLTVRLSPPPPPPPRMRGLRHLRWVWRCPAGTGCPRPAGGSVNFCWECGAALEWCATLRLRLRRRRPPLLPTPAELL